MLNNTNTTFGGGAALITEADLPNAELPRHPFTGEILPRKDAMGVPQPLNVRVVDLDDEEGRYQPVAYYDEFTGGYRC